MYIAMPVQDRALASHFTKASSFALFDKKGDLIKQFDNPALQSGCEGKSNLVELLNLYQVSEVVVKNIGERMLGKLLAAKITVKKANQRGLDIVSLFNHIDGFPLLTDADQGRESVNYREKQKSGGCCNHEHGDQHQHAHKHQHQHKHEHKHNHGGEGNKQGRCCGDNSGEHQHQGKNKGQGRCCQK